MFILVCSHILASMADQCTKICSTIISCGSDCRRPVIKVMHKQKSNFIWWMLLTPKCDSMTELVTAKRNPAPTFVTISLHPFKRSSKNQNQNNKETIKVFLFSTLEWHGMMYLILNRYCILCAPLRVYSKKRHPSLGFPRQLWIPNRCSEAPQRTTPGMAVDCIKHDQVACS